MCDRHTFAQMQHDYQLHVYKKKLLQFKPQRNMTHTQSMGAKTNMRAF